MWHIHCKADTPLCKETWHNVHNPKCICVKLDKDKWQKCAFSKVKCMDLTPFGIILNCVCMFYQWVAWQSLGPSQRLWEAGMSFTINQIIGRIIDFIEACRCPINLNLSGQFVLRAPLYKWSKPSLMYTCVIVSMFSHFMVHKRNKTKNINYNYQ